MQHCWKEVLDLNNQTYKSKATMRIYTEFSLQEKKILITKSLLTTKAKTSLEIFKLLKNTVKQKNRINL